MATAEEMANLRTEMERQVLPMKQEYEDKLAVMELHYKSLINGMKEEREQQAAEKKVKDLEKDDEKLDVLCVRKGFDVLPKFSGKLEEYEDWKFQVERFMGFEKNFKMFTDWVRKLPDPPTQETLHGPEGNISNCPPIDKATLGRMNTQLYNLSLITI